MRRTIVLLAAAVLCAVPPAMTALSCSDGAGRTEQEKSIVDDQGRAFAPGPAPRRIVSLAPNITEILFAFGLGDAVVGVTRFCDYPKEALGKAKIGGLVDPNPEMIQSLSPDLVVAYRGNPLRTIDRLRAIGLPVFVLDIGKSVDSLFPLLDKLGRVTRREAEAERIAAGLRARLGALRERLAGVRERPRVFLALQGNGLWTCGGESYIHDLIERCAAENVAGAIPRDWLHYNLEQLVRDDPEIIVVLARTEKDFQRARDKFLADRRLRRVSAVKTGRVYFLDENITSRFGPRLVTALEETARNIHPERFEAPL
jgi:iron complex transport system substrate-binding protein